MTDTEITSPSNPQVRQIRRLHTRRERGFIVAGLDVHARLNDGRAAVEFRRHEMHGRAVRRIVGRERLAMSVQAGILGQQRRMDVEDPAAIPRDEIGRQDAHEPCQYDQRWFALVDGRR